ncbi:Hypothetical predicted protein [Olea europaea subsp. europaea]|uniref:Uncharacterized protein n=1 Tax=Olea europaea subsp. europaea TaxID=158383 RepID=A0A8S0PM01_OLEEU|nr:Hypothetical predicted protein [Olea europaea subsp. europaea]
MEEGETSKNKLSLDPTSTENQVIGKMTEVLTEMNENKDEPQKQTPPSIVETEVETVLLEEDGKLTEQILVQHQDGCLSLERNTETYLLPQEFGDHRDLIQQEIFIQHVQEAIEVEMNISEEQIQKTNTLVQPPSQVDLNDNQIADFFELLQQKIFSVTRPNGEDLEGEDGKMRREGTTIPQRQKKKKIVMLSEVITRSKTSSK